MRTDLTVIQRNNIAALEASFDVACFVKLAVMRKRENPKLQFTNNDGAYMRYLVNAMMTVPKDGDGKFSRSELYVKGVLQEVDWLKRNLVGAEDDLAIFYACIEASYLAIDYVLKEIKGR